MKILIIQGSPKKTALDYNYTIALNLKRAFEYYEHNVEIWGSGHDNFNDVINFNKYDIIFNVENYWGDWLPNLENCKAYKIMWAIDMHVLGETHFKDEFNRSKYNLLLQASYHFLDKDQAWFPCAFDDTMMIPMIDVSKTSTIGFCGNLHNRKPIIDFLKEKKYNITVDNKYGKDMVTAINSYKIHLNKNISVDINLRNFETIGCGTLLLSQFSPDYEKLGFIDGKNCLLYKNENELLDRLNDVLTNEDMYNKLSKSGYELSKHHTYKQRILKLLDYLKGKV